MNLWPETLQDASSMVCGWLLGADTKTFDCVHLTELLQTLPKFANLPVACRKHILKLDMTEKFADPKTAPQGIVILCDGEFLTETNIAMKATFNRSSTKAIAERPDGLNFKYIEYYAEPKSKSPTHKQAAQKITASKQRHGLPNKQTTAQKATTFARIRAKLSTMKKTKRKTYSPTFTQNYRPP
jgi:hypothetical protein